MGYFNDLFKIFRGLSANDESGTPARSAGEGLNNNFDRIDNGMEAINNAAEKTANKAVTWEVVDDIKFPTVKNVDARLEQRLLAEIGGISLTADQAAQKIFAKNASGEILSEISVAFLNNEGTTFFYNETTKNLELKNDVGAILSEIPVSAFVSNVAAQLGLSGSSLSLKDTAGNILNSVTIGISNIQGLQAALDGKEDAFTKNTAFNKDFGTTTGTVAQGSVAATNASNITKNTNRLDALKANSFTGTDLELSNVFGNNYNYAAPSGALSYTTKNPVVNGHAPCLVNAASEPVVYETDGSTPATKINGADFQPNTNMELIVESRDGVNIRYFFLAL